MHLHHHLCRLSMRLHENKTSTSTHTIELREQSGVLDIAEGVEHGRKGDSEALSASTYY